MIKICRIQLPSGLTPFGESKPVTEVVHKHKRATKHKALPSFLISIELQVQKEEVPKILWYELLLFQWREVVWNFESFHRSNLQLGLSNKLQSWNLCVVMRMMICIRGKKPVQSLVLCTTRIALTHSRLTDRPKSQEAEFWFGCKKT